MLEYATRLDTYTFPVDFESESTREIYAEVKDPLAADPVNRDCLKSLHDLHPSSPGTQQPAAGTSGDRSFGPASSLSRGLRPVWYLLSCVIFLAPVPVTF